VPLAAAERSTYLGDAVAAERGGVTLSADGDETGRIVTVPLAPFAVAAVRIRRA
jgi:hypothetical protein